MSTHGRTRDLVNMAKDVGLEVVSHYGKQNRVCVDVRAENGVTASFSLSNTSRSDVRGDLNEQSRMKRFARANGMPAAQQPEDTMQRTITLKKPTETAAAQELTPIEFYRLCEYIKSMDVASASSLEVLTRGAASHLGCNLSEASVREAMTATSTAEPECWTPLADPHTIIARELAALMESLGQTPSSQLKRYLATLA